MVLGDLPAGADLDDGIGAYILPKLVVVIDGFDDLFATVDVAETLVDLRKVQVLCAVMPLSETREGAVRR